MYIKRILRVLIPGSPYPCRTPRIPVSFVSRVPVSGDLGTYKQTNKSRNIVFRPTILVDTQNTIFYDFSLAMKFPISSINHNQKSLHHQPQF